MDSTVYYYYDRPSQEENRASWYMKKEYKLFRLEVFQTLDELHKAHGAGLDGSSDTICARGLEKFLNYRCFRNNSSNNICHFHQPGLRKSYVKNVLTLLKQMDNNSKESNNNNNVIFDHDSLAVLASAYSFRDQFIAKRQASKDALDALQLYKQDSPSLQKKEEKQQKSNSIASSSLKRPTVDQPLVAAFPPTRTKIWL